MLRSLIPYIQKGKNRNRNQCLNWPYAFFKGYSYVAPSIVYGETTTLDDCLKTPFENRNLSAGIRQASFFEVKMRTECFNGICNP